MSVFCIFLILANIYLSGAEALDDPCTISFKALGTPLTHSSEAFIQNYIEKNKDSAQSLFLGSYVSEFSTAYTQFYRASGQNTLCISGVLAALTTPERVAAYNNGSHYIRFYKESSGHSESENLIVRFLPSVLVSKQEAETGFKKAEADFQKMLTKAADAINDSMGEVVHTLSKANISKLKADEELD